MCAYKCVIILSELYLFQLLKLGQQLKASIKEYNDLKESSGIQLKAWTEDLTKVQSDNERLEMELRVAHTKTSADQDDRATKLHEELHV